MAVTFRHLQAAGPGQIAFKLEPGKTKAGKIRKKFKTEDSSAHLDQYPIFGEKNRRDRLGDIGTRFAIIKSYFDGSMRVASFHYDGVLDEHLSLFRQIVTISADQKISSSRLLVW